VAVDPEGTLFTGVEDGRILRVGPDEPTVEAIAHTGGRPLGIEFSIDGTLIVCDAYKGLLRVDPVRRSVEPLVEVVEGQRMRFCDNADVASDGSVFFTDSSKRFGLDQWRADIFEHSGTGRLLRWEPNGGVEILLEGLEFANGVALSADEAFVAVAETGAYRITRLWLTGERAGQRDVLIENLPGHPDNLSREADGLIWMALPSPRLPLVDRLHRMSPLIKRAVWRIPEYLQPQPKRTMWAMAVDDTGRVVHDLQAEGDVHSMVTGVRRHGDRLYLGSLTEPAIAVLDLP
jgi:sugar lactone lactonase YvrE